MTERESRRRILPPSEIGALIESIQQLLADPQAGLDRDSRLRWEGALTVLEAVLARPSSLLPALRMEQLL